MILKLDIEKYYYSFFSIEGIVFLIYILLLPFIGLINNMFLQVLLILLITANMFILQTIGIRKFIKNCVKDWIIDISEKEMEQLIKRYNEEKKSRKSKTRKKE